MQVRLATERDLAAMTEIYNQAIGDGYLAGDTEPVTIHSMQLWLKQLSPDTTPVYVVEREQAIVGFAYLNRYRYGRAAFENTREISYFVDKKRRREGIAGALMQQALEFARQTGIKNLVAFLLESNRPGVLFLREYKFEQWGRLPGIAELPDGVYDQVIYGRKIEVP